MSSDPTTAAPAQTPTALQGFFVLLAVIVGVAIYLGIHHLLHIEAGYAGFLLLLYWSGIKGSAPAELTPAFFGALGGVLLAYLLWFLPTVMGGGGAIVALLAIIVAVYMLIMGWMPMVVNNAMMLLLTVGTIGAIQTRADFAGMAASVLLAGALSALMVTIGRMMSRRKKMVPASTAG
jgi:hypothetical protein